MLHPSFELMPQSYAVYNDGTLLGQVRLAGRLSCALQPAFKTSTESNNMADALCYRATGAIAPKGWCIPTALLGLIYSEFSGTSRDIKHRNLRFTHQKLKVQLRCIMTYTTPKRTR
jgi:hypothetical protein